MKSKEQPSGAIAAACGFWPGADLAKRPSANRPFRNPQQEALQHVAALHPVGKQVVSAASSIKWLVPQL